MSGGAPAGGAVCQSCAAEYSRDFVGTECLFCESPLARDFSPVGGDYYPVQGGDALGDVYPADEYLTLFPVDYLGGYPGLLDPFRRLYVYVSSREFLLCASEVALLRLNMDDVVAIEAEGPTELQKRVTVTRLFALGIFALAVPKGQKLAYLVVTTNEGEIVVSTNKHTALELRTLLNRYVGAHQLESSSAPPQLTNVSLADELERCASLYERGLLTADEFAEAKRLLLERSRSE